MNEQQNHLSQLIEQRVTLSQQLEGSQAQTTRTRDLMLKTQGAIEYWKQPELHCRNQKSPKKQKSLKRKS